MATKKKSKKTASKSSTKKSKPAKKARAKARFATPPLGLSLVGVGPSITANDVSKSLHWYCDVVGFTIGERWEKDGVLLGAELKAGKVSFWVGQDDWKKGRDRQKGVGFRLYCTTTQDVDALARQIQSRGGVLDAPVADTPHGTREFALVDPDGFRITIAKET
jgi:uncharacterized glyoxalase superfamily protein PhnB